MKNDEGYGDEDFFERHIEPSTPQSSEPDFSSGSAYHLRDVSEGRYQKYNLSDLNKRINNKVKKQKAVFIDEGKGHGFDSAGIVTTKRGAERITVLSPLEQLAIESADHAFTISKEDVDCARKYYAQMQKADLEAFALADKFKYHIVDKGEVYVLRNIG